jgi:hypothetical protein
MPNLFWKRKTKTINLISKPFKTEEEFEKTIFETKELFADIHFLKRQIRGGKKTEIPDIIGVDSDSNVCIIEMKNVTVDESIIPQVLNYAIWAQNNPDSLEALWLKMEEQPDVEMDWDKYTVRIIVIAPDIDPITLKFTNSISYPVELVEIKRWIDRNQTFLLVNKLESKQTQKIKTTKGLENYDKEFYKSYRNNRSVEDFFEYIQQTEKLLKTKGVSLEKKFNKYYCGFKSGFFNVFSISWVGSKSFAYMFRLPENVAKRKQGKLKMDRYLYGRAYYNITPGKTKPHQFWNLIKESLQHLGADED